MGLKKIVESEIKGAMKSRDAERLGVFRMLLAALHNREIEKRTRSGDSELNKDEAMAVLKSEVKKRKDAAGEFEKAGRTDLAEKEKREQEILEKYLPAELSDEEIEILLAPLAQGAAEKDFGRVMAAAMKAVAGSTSGERVAAAVKRMLTDR